MTSQMTADRMTEILERIVRISLEIGEIDGLIFGDPVYELSHCGCEIIAGAILVTGGRGYLPLNKSGTMLLTWHEGITGKWRLELVDSYDLYKRTIAEANEFLLRATALDVVGA